MHKIIITFLFIIFSSLAGAQERHTSSNNDLRHDSGYIKITNNTNSWLAMTIEEGELLPRIEPQATLYVQTLQSDPSAMTLYSCERFVNNPKRPERAMCSYNKSKKLLIDIDPDCVITENIHITKDGYLFSKDSALDCSKKK